MKQLQQILYRATFIVLGILSFTTYAQKEKKTYKETFNVAKDVVLDINTSHTDIVFETWNKDQIKIEALIEIEGVSSEEAEEYFKNNAFKILGNSKKVEVRTNSMNSRSFGNTVVDFDFNIPEIDVESILFEMPVIPELPEMPELLVMPEMPTVPNFSMQDFDFSAYEEEGEKYLKKWKKEFDKNFDKDFKKEFIEWSQELKENGERIREEVEVILEERMESREKGKKSLKRRKEVHEEKRRVLKRHRVERQRVRRVMGDTLLVIDSLHFSRAPSIFYLNSDGKEKHLKVKKTIKIKMPKGTKIKMNVRHGEVKLAENTKNINATLSHSRLLASTIEGDKTVISASYSPVFVDKWNYGQLSTKYSDIVDLKEVLHLSLQSVSSEISIGHLLKSAFVKNKMGSLEILKVAADFKDLDVSLQNSELSCKLPNTAYTIYVNGTESELVVPSSLKLQKTKNHQNIVYKGYSKNKNSDKSIMVNSKYSKVVLK